MPPPGGSQKWSFSSPKRCFSRTPLGGAEKAKKRCFSGTPGGRRFGPENGAFRDPPWGEPEWELLEPIRDPQGGGVTKSAQTGRNVTFHDTPQFSRCKMAKKGQKTAFPHPPLGNGFSWLFEAFRPIRPGEPETVLFEPFGSLFGYPWGEAFGAKKRPILSILEVPRKGQKRLKS